MNQDPVELIWCVECSVLSRISANSISALEFRRSILESLSSFKASIASTKGGVPFTSKGRIQSRAKDRNLS